MIGLAHFALRNTELFFYKINVIFLKLDQTKLIDLASFVLINEKKNSIKEIT